MTETTMQNAATTKLLATFVLHDALCAFDAARVQEVIRMGPVTAVRHAPEEVTGVINLRGRIVTLLDLGRILGFAKTEPNRDSRIFIIEDRGEFIGLLVDRAADVMELDPAAEERVPANLSLEQKRYIRGVQRAADGRVIALLDLGALLPAAQ
jgi:purine-binding chemotaxis protein CheW